MYTVYFCIPVVIEYVRVVSNSKKVAKTEIGRQLKTIMRQSRRDRNRFPFIFSHPFPLGALRAQGF